MTFLDLSKKLYDPTPAIGALVTESVLLALRTARDLVAFVVPDAASQVRVSH
jgi:hypothetical protein